RRYLPTGEPTNVESLVEGQMLTVVADVLSSRIAPYQDRRTQRTAYRVEAVIKTDGPALRLTTFAKSKHVADWQVERLVPGAKGVFTGKVNKFNNNWQLAHPQMIMLTDEPGDARTESALAMAEGLKSLFPIYSVTGPVETWDIQRVISFALTVVDEIPEVLPESVRAEHRLVDVHTALRWIHSPDDQAQLGAARKRFRFEEALVTQLVLARRRAAHRALGTVPRAGGGGLLQSFDESLPFTLTQGQQEIGQVLEEELAGTHPMNRLLQGEVGSGKTLVALRAMLRVVDSGGQAVLLAPTEVLAQQHHRSITAMLGPLAEGGLLGGSEHATVVDVLTGSMTKGQRREVLLRMASGESGLVIGTHALLEEHVSFADLGLVVVDEQHRFGVEQRAALVDKAEKPPHVLVMTATPIPRTVAMTVFGDLEISTLRELPAGRAPIQTNVVALKDHPAWISRVWERVREEVAKGHQAYVVCPRISGNDEEEGQVDQLDVDSEGAEIQAAREGQLAAVEELCPQLAAGPLAGLKVEVLHGRMAPEDKDRVMRAFAAGSIDVLVSTTVIEVGVDVANATAMVLMDADRFGVSQLHQLRGRVGRGGLPGLCLLVSHCDLGTPARERLDAVAATTDGFELSEIDLEQRHEGDVLGAGQSGFRSSLQHLRVVRDAKVIVTARDAAERMLADDPDLAGAPHLAVEVDELDRASQSDFMERS
ncbi:MAG TPA: ATP-dependent DNA helicase RecG, partial [Nocardioides sp.]